MAVQEKNEKASKQTREQHPAEFDLGLGKLSLGGLFKGLGNLIELAGKVAEEGGEIRHEKAFTTKGPGGKELNGIFGVSIRTLEGGRPVFETFGNIKKTAKGPVVEEVREPIVDLFDEKGYIRLIAEVPGVNEEGMSVELKGDILSLSATGTERRYAKEILLPCPVKETSLQKSFRNGILEIKLEKA